MSIVKIEIPDSLQKSLNELANREGISIDQLVSTAIAEKISALMTEDYLKERGQRGSREKYDRILAKVPDVEPEPYDRKQK
ncbi:toxin-antitoxin system HicB family antitoxin [Roseofilum sp. BLCC_M154]|uniref:Toxin-antitoxin system HicB family antitoxin n=1 Tax=Roseofilum acuticapitatum BLCC-M154 TaxID=3022444 RepID=A0ABT7AN74_9CYAN|nr:hypothetical protein [Roseofilum acuticapitatum]MDJ1168335.1 toxin-antitoxin system HicB family antitoxin [Roseofilum acuticapitatum BLCC-M154]